MSVAETRQVPGQPSAHDDTVLPFAVESLDIRGQVIRLGSTVTAILNRHAYPKPVSRLLSEAIALTALLGVSLKFDGRFILQTQSDGPVSMIVIEFSTPERIRAYARYDADAIAEIGDANAARDEDLLGTGHLAMTIDQGEHMRRYQGVVPLDGRSLEAAAHQYFMQSEQIPTIIRLATAELITKVDGKSTPSWRSGGILVQFLPDDLDRLPRTDIDPGDAPEGYEQSENKADDAWIEGEARAASVEDIELTDPDLTAEDLLLRLFNEHDIRIFEPRSIIDRCRCSREKIDAMLRGFSARERSDMVVDDVIVVTCEFCGLDYRFDQAAFEGERPDGAESV